MAVVAVCLVVVWLVEWWPGVPGGWCAWWLGAGRHAVVMAASSSASLSSPASARRRASREIRFQFFSTVSGELR
jgi:hypothetical protein